MFSSPEIVKMLQFLGPETAENLQFPGPEIAVMLQSDFWAQKLQKCCNFRAQKLRLCSRDPLSRMVKFLIHLKSEQVRYHHIFIQILKGFAEINSFFYFCGYVLTNLIVWIKLWFYLGQKEKNDNRNFSKRLLGSE